MKIAEVKIEELDNNFDIVVGLMPIAIYSNDKIVIILEENLKKLRSSKVPHVVLCEYTVFATEREAEAHFDTVYKVRTFTKVEITSQNIIDFILKNIPEKDIIEKKEKEFLLLGNYFEEFENSSLVKVKLPFFLGKTAKMKGNKNAPLLDEEFRFFLKMKNRIVYINEWNKGYESV